MSNMSGMQARTPAKHKKHPKAHSHAHKAAAKTNAMGNMQGTGKMPGMEQKPSQHETTQGSSMGGMQGMGTGAEQTPSRSGTAQGSSKDTMQGMEGMQKKGHIAGMEMTGLFGGYAMSRDASGTSWQPDLAEHRGIHVMAGDWMLMGHLTLLGIYDTQSGPRGDDKFFPSGMIMGMARRDLSPADLLSFRVMLSPEPFMGRRGYPLLLQTGETANGVTPLIDRQHPHDLFMELSGLYDHKVSSEDSAFLYFGYPGEPALGPPAFMHRASGADNPVAPLTHHWLDSTHIDFGVVTAGFVHDDWKVEVSQFTGREPDQHRFDFDKPQFDSTSVRASWNPDAHWSLQASYGHLHSPEQLEPTVNEDRYTASAMYVTKLGDESSLSAMLAWGLKHLSDGSDLNGLLLEGEYKPCDLWTIFARSEWEQNNEIVSQVTSDIGELSFGVIRDFPVAEHWKLGLGGQFAFDFTPGQAIPTYGATPRGGTIFVRIAAQ